MTYLFWAILLNSLVNPIALLTDTYLSVDLSFLMTIIVLGLILKGLSTLNRTQRNFQSAKTFSIILLGLAIINGVISLVENTTLSGGVLILMMGSGIIALLNEYHLIKGIQSYDSVLSKPKETVSLLKYWKTNLISNLVLGVTVFISALVIVFSFALAAGIGDTVVDLNTILADPQTLIESLRPSAPILIVLLILLTGAILVSFTTRILFYISMYHVQKDHQLVLKTGSVTTAVE